MKTNNLKSLVLLGIVTLALFTVSCQKDEHWTPTVNNTNVIEVLTNTTLEFVTTDTTAIVTGTKNINGHTGKATLSGNMLSIKNLSYTESVFTINGREYKLAGRKD